MPRAKTIHRLSPEKELQLDDLMAKDGTTRIAKEIGLSPNGLTSVRAGRGTFPTFTLVSTFLDSRAKSAA